MSRAESDDDRIEPPHPRATVNLFGHAEAEQALLSAYQHDRFPHAWLLGGPQGIGKATLAFRLARFVLAHPDQADAAVQGATSLAVDAEHPVAHRIAAQAHTDLLVLERTVSETGVLRTVIQVEDVRRTVSFFGSTAGEGGWRVCVIDSVEDLNSAGANALLKVLEEPPTRALFLLISHAPGRLLPTIRSRCRRLTLRALDAPDVIKAAALAMGQDPQTAAIDPAAALVQAASVADGSVARAIGLLTGDTLVLRQRVEQMLARLPAIDDPALHTLGDGLGRANEGAFEVVVGAMRDWLSAQLDSNATNPACLARIAEVWDKLNTAAREVEDLNLERKPMIFAAFGLLADAARQ